MVNTSSKLTSYFMGKQVTIILSLLLVFACFLQFKNPSCINVPASIEKMKNIQFSHQNKRYKFV